MPTKVRDKQLLGLRAEWHGDSQLRVRAQHITKSDKIIVDVMELSHGRMVRNGTALRVARNFARQCGASNMDAIQLSDFRADKQTTNLDGVKGTVKIRHTFFVFQGVNS